MTGDRAGAAVDALAIARGNAAAWGLEEVITAYHRRAREQWHEDRHDLPSPWNTLSIATDSLVMATPEQFEGLAARLEEMLATWREQCIADEAAQPDADRQPVRFFATAFPSGPVRPAPHP